MNQLKMLCWLILMLQCTQLVWSSGDMPYLYYTTYGIGWENSGGLYGGPIHVHANHSEASNLTQVGIRCASLETHNFQEGLEIHGISYDPAKKSVLVQLNPHGDRQFVFTTNICGQGPPTCQDSQINAIFARGQAKDENYADAVGPFAMYDGRVYFVADRFEKVSDEDAKHVIEIRRLEGCEDRYPFYMVENDLDISACSKFVGVVAEEVSYYHRTPEDMDMYITAVGNLHIVRLGGGVGFLIQVKSIVEYDYEYDEIIEFAMPLILVKNGKPTELHHGALEETYGEISKIPHLGGISFRDDVVCWTVFDRILCAKWTGSGDLQNVITALPKSTASDVCTGRGNFDGLDHENIVTGIAIADAAGDVIKLFFGCYTKDGQPGRGGAGFLRIGKDGENRLVERLEDDAGPIHAGSLFIGCEKHAVGGATSYRKSAMLIYTLAASLFVLASPLS